MYSFCVCPLSHSSLFLHTLLLLLHLELTFHLHFLFLFHFFLLFHFFFFFLLLFLLQILLDHLFQMLLRLLQGPILFRFFIFFFLFFLFFILFFLVFMFPFLVSEAHQEGFKFFAGPMFVFESKRFDQHVFISGLKPGHSIGFRSVWVFVQDHFLGFETESLQEILQQLLSGLQWDVSYFHHEFLVRVRLLLFLQPFPFLDMYH